MTPNFKCGVYKCQACNSTDNVSLVITPAEAVTWCACGKVWVSHNREDKQVYDFTGEEVQKG